jgi:hypothetical protein
MLSFSFEISALATASFDRRLNRAGKIAPTAFCRNYFCSNDATPTRCTSTTTWFYGHCEQNSYGITSAAEYFKRGRVNCHRGIRFITLRRASGPRSSEQTGLRPVAGSPSFQTSRTANASKRKFMYVKARRSCSLLVMQASLAGSWVPWYDIRLFFLRVGLTKIWELGTDPIAIRGSAVLEGPV